MQTMPYLNDPDKRIRVHLYVDTRKIKPRYLSSYCWLTQGISPCKGDISSPCGQCWAKCNHPSKALCADEVGQLVDENENIPDYVKVEWADFAPENWETKTHIDNTTIYSDPASPGELKRNLQKYHELRLKYFLRDWSLKDYGKDFELQIIQAKGMTKGVKELSQDSLSLVKTKLDPEFVENLVQLYDRKADLLYSEIAENAIAEVREKLGLEAKN